MSSIKDLMGIGYGEEPNMSDEMFFDQMLNAVADSANEVSKNIWDIPHERIFEFEKTISDAIATLMIAKIKLTDRKQ